MVLRFSSGIFFLFAVSQSWLVLPNLSLGAALLHGLELLLLNGQIQELVELLLGIDHI